MDTKKKIFGEIEEIEDEVEREFNRFNNFRVVCYEPSDHHYSTQLDYLSAKFIHTLRFKQRMDEERRTLEEHTPGSIFVRAYTNRIDLMRAAFIGPPGSDYQHCLFFFDIFFPSNYPADPPMIHTIEPSNLQSDGNGKISLEFVKTWYDRLKQRLTCSSSEKKWNGKEGNVLNLLGSIQKLILDFCRPYSGRRKSFAAACERMIGVMRKPPIGFECLVAGHFRRRAHPVLLKFKQNEYNDKVMASLFITMFTLFEKNGAYCQHHLDFLKTTKRKIITEEVDQELPWKFRILHI